MAERRQSARLVLGLGLCAAAAAWLQAGLAGVVADPDSFYHVGHAARYAAGSPFDTSLPWARHSVIGDVGADLWWGYHLLLMPLAASLPVPSAIRWAGVLGTGALLATVLVVLAGRGVGRGAAWTGLLVVAVPNVTYRLLMARPHVLSLAAALVLAWALANRRIAWAAGAAFVLAWLHASLFWLVPALLGAWALALALERRLPPGGTPDPSGESAPPRPLRLTATDSPSALHLAAFTLVGVAAGLLLRPRPLGTLRLVDVQLFQLMRQRGTDPSLRIGGELLPLEPSALGASAWLLLVPWTLAGAALAVAWLRRSAALQALPAAERILATTAAVTSGAFLVLSLTVAGRALVEWATFGIVALAMAWPAVLPGRTVRRTGSAVLATVALVSLPWAWGWHAANVELNAVPGNELREIATWLEENSRPDDLVFHARWDSFGPLFAWNRTNHYLGGMDPIFQHARDPARWAEVAGLTGPGPLTSDPTATIAAFAPRWVLVEAFRDPALYRALRSDPRWDVVRLTSREAVFERVDGS